MKKLKTILLFISIVLLTSCGASKKSSEKHKYEAKTEVSTKDSIKVIKEVNNKKDSLVVTVKEISEADSIIIVERETVLPDGTINTEKITKVHKPKKEIKVDTNNKKEEHSSKIDSTAIAKVDSTSHVKQQDEKSTKTSVSVPFYVYIIIVVLLIIANKKWELLTSLMGILKKLWGLIKP